MFDVSASELLVIGAVALIVIGPKELPGVLRMVGQTVGKLKRMAGEFRTQFDDAMREADLHEIQKSVTDAKDSVSKFNPISTIRNEISSTVQDMKSATRSVEAEVAKPVGAAAAKPEEQGPPVMALDPVPEPAPVRITPAVEPQPTPDVVRTASALAPEAPKKPKRPAKKKPAGDAE
jgi:sec-independent protein translocase protein TatB